MDLFIYGSCVSRDTLEFVKPPNVSLRGYVARQSWCSIGSATSEPRFLDVDIPSKFRKRIYTDDLAGNALDLILAAHKKHPDLCLMVDLTDERGGFFRNGDGVIISNTYDSPAAGMLRRDAADWTHVLFGTLDHFLSFADAAQELQKALVSAGLFDRTVVVQNTWAAKTTTGEPTPPSFGFMADEANEAFDDYFGLLRELGWAVAVPGSSNPLTDAEHRWGVAPFHYSSDYYDSVWAATTEAFDAHS